MPLPGALVVKNGSKMCSSVAGVDAFAGVRHAEHHVLARRDLELRALRRRRAARDRGTASAGRRAGIASRALMTRFITTCSNWPGSISTSCGGSAWLKENWTSSPISRSIIGCISLDGATEIDDPALEHLLAAEGEQLLGQPRRALRRPCGSPTRRDASARPAGSSFDQELAEAEDHGQQVVEVVGDAAGQPADGLHALRVPQALLGGLQGGLRAALHAAIRRLAQLALDRGAEPAQVVLEDVVVRAGAHGLDRRVLADGARDDDERDVGVVVAEQAQGVGGAEALHRVVARGRRPRRPP